MVEEEEDSKLKLVATTKSEKMDREQCECKTDYELTKLKAQKRSGC